MKTKISILIMSLITLSLCLLSSCSNGSDEKKSPVMNEKITADNFKNLVNKLNEDSRFTRDDLVNLRLGALQLNDSLIGKTVEQVIKLGFELQRNEQMRELNQIADIIRMKSLIRIDITDFKELENNQGYRVYLKVKNVSNKVIKSISSELRIKNKTGNSVSLPITDYKLNLAPGAEVSNFFDLTGDNMNDFRGFINNDIANVGALEWLNHAIIFNDGEKAIVGGK